MSIGIEMFADLCHSRHNALIETTVKTLCDFGKSLLAMIVEQDSRIKALEFKVAQAYQAISLMKFAGEIGFKIPEDALVRAQDFFSDPEWVDDDYDPFRGVKFPKEVLEAIAQKEEEGKNGE